MSIPITRELEDAVHYVVSETSPADFVVFGLVPGASKLKVIETAEGGVEAFLDYVSEGKILFGLIKLKVDNTPKLIFVAWCGSGVQGLPKGRFPSYTSQLENSLFKGHHLKICTENEQDITETTLISKLTAGPSKQDATPKRPNLQSTSQKADPEVPVAGTPPLSAASPGAGTPPRSAASPGAVSPSTSEASLTGVPACLPTKVVSPKTPSSPAIGVLSPRVRQQAEEAKRLAEKEEMAKQRAEASARLKEQAQARKVAAKAKEEKDQSQAKQAQKEEEAKKAQQRKLLVDKLSESKIDLTRDQIVEALKKFDELDTNHNGVIDRAEFFKAKRMLLPNSSRHLWQSLANNFFSKVASDGTDGITPEQFVSAYKYLFANERKQVALMLLPMYPGWSVEKIEEALENFEKHDLDGNGVLDKDEFYQLKEQLVGPEFSKILLKRATDAAFMKADDDKSGEISEIEFLNFYKSIDSIEVVQTNPGTPNVHEAFNELVMADTFEGTLLRFTELKEVCSVPQDSTEIYPRIRQETLSNIRAKVLWQLLDTKRRNKEYDSPGMENARILIVGAGPAGLRAAIEYILLGAHVTIIEKRRTFTRNNLLHLWDSSIRDLKNIGAKFFFPQFCVGGINHIAIRRLQLLLLKVCLILGAKVYTSVDFRSIGKPTPDPETGRPLWKPEIHIRKKEAKTPPEEDLLYNVLVGADGENSLVGNLAGFERKIFQGAEAIGITANFINGKTKAETSIDEFGVLAVYNQGYFNELKNNHAIELENLVYYRGETHYFVMTAKRTSLLEVGVCKQDFPDVLDLLKPSNLDHDKLEKLVRTVATHNKLPTEVVFSPGSSPSGNDIAIFDFSKKKLSIDPFRFLSFPGTEYQLPVCLVGDALIEPFWPLGTGANRAFLSAMDSAWMLKLFFSPHFTGHESLKEEMMQHYKILMVSLHDDLQKNHSLHSLDPSTRYNLQTHAKFH